MQITKSTRERVRRLVAICSRVNTTPDSGAFPVRVASGFGRFGAFSRHSSTACRVGL